MKRTSNKLFLYSLTSLAVMASHVAYAETLVTAPTLEGGISASIGALYLTPSVDGQDYIVSRTFSDSGDITSDDVIEVNPGYDFGWEASLGYLFEGTANGVELSYRGINTNDDDSITVGDNNVLIAPLFESALEDTIGSASSSVGYELNAADLMIHQFLDIGTHVQMRFSAGASYLNLESDQNDTYYAFDYDGVSTSDLSNQFSGFGPRVAADGRYEFGDGFGLLGGASLAYYIGDLDVSQALFLSNVNEFDTGGTLYDEINNHVITNLRANIGIDYVYFLDNEDRSTIGIELGYLVDYYADAVQKFNIEQPNGRGEKASSAAYQDSDSNALTFSGPYLEIKGVF